jgi:ketosteroid isomerase-like protein
MTNDPTSAQCMEHVIRTYVKALNDADCDAVAACFCADAVHYFPAHPRISGAVALGSYFAASVRRREISWTVDQILVDVGRCAATLEWTRFDPSGPRHMRGVDWFVFEPETIRFREVRTYLAAKGDPRRENLELQDFDYAGRGYPVRASNP